ncbi:nitrogen regulatory protein p-ii homolog [Phtheirospermum japonicum]|uniref:Nitrogen regulatory protein p-ii homolog n=2 Tax=Phtheirospermum japonicum TaxID=374723 RepID=A0A830CB43_9LAMI|nr:nitrogen regulatory protein p-ii homolog [Phtheirospermum japonicum]
MASASIAKSNAAAINALQSPLQNLPKFTAISLTPCLREFRPSPLSSTLNRAANGSSLPVIRSQSSPDYVPEANFYKVEAVLRQFSSYACLLMDFMSTLISPLPWRIPQVSSDYSMLLPFKRSFCVEATQCIEALSQELYWMIMKALLKMGIRGVTVSDVRGFGAQGGSTERQAGSEFSEDNFVSKVKMEIVVCKDQVEEVIEKIIQQARTGEIGDGKIFLTPVADIIRVRTGERGEKAERMTGGRADMSSAGSSA